MIPAIRTMGFFALLFLSLCLGLVNAACAAAPAAPEAGVVVNMEGSVVAKGPDGVLRALALGNKVFAGDMLFTGKDSHARIKFSDGGIMTLKSQVQFLIDSFNFDANQPKADQAAFTLIKGGLRAVSGLVGKRGDPDSYGLKTRAATIGIRGTDFGVRLCRGDCADVTTPDGLPLEDGLHVDVVHGVVLVKNTAGSQLVHAGEFTYVRDEAYKPVEIPADRGVRVDVPARMTIDKVRGEGTGGHGGGGGPANVCPAN